jgi:hypothetical protein
MIARAKKQSKFSSRMALPANYFQGLDLSAPVPSYQLDKILMENPFEIKSLKRFEYHRNNANLAAHLSKSATEEYIERSVDVASARMLFERLHQIETLIADIQKVNVGKIGRIIRLSNRNLTRQREARIIYGAAKSLQSSLRKTKTRIGSFTSQHAVMTLPKGNNRDVFTANFIWEFGLGFGVGPEFLVKNTLFAKLLAAAWRDLKLPLEDRRGRSREPLERWFADRLRHFTSPKDGGL